MKSVLSRSHEIAKYTLWPKVTPFIKPGIKPEHLAKLNKFIPQYAEIIAREEAKDDRVTMPVRLSWDGVWTKHLDRLRDG